MRVVDVLEAAGIGYMLTGSMASSVQGRPRSTHDIDLVVSLPPGAVDTLVNAFPPPQYYLPEAAIRDAIRDRSMFNLIVPSEDDKVDFWVLGNEAYDRARFQRRVVTVALGRPIRVSSPEDTIVGKLRWSELSGGSEKQFTDALAVYEVQYPTLDIGYIEHWVRELGLQPHWDRLKAEARPL